MQRRQFIQITAAGALGAGLTGAVWLPTAGASSSGVPSTGMLARPELLSMVDGRTVAGIGRAYRAAHPDERTAEALASDILSDAGLAATASEPAVRERVARRVRDDFARRRTVEVDGWILSVTEARQCALYAAVTAA